MAFVRLISHVLFCLGGGGTLFSEHTRAIVRFFVVLFFWFFEANSHLHKWPCRKQPTVVVVVHRPVVTVYSHHSFLQTAGGRLTQAHNAPHTSLCSMQTCDSAQKFTHSHIKLSGKISENVTKTQPVSTLATFFAEEYRGKIQKKKKRRCG